MQNVSPLTGGSFFGCNFVKKKETFQLYNSETNAKLSNLSFAEMFLISFII